MCKNGRVAIHQPQYWPWPPYLHKILSADVFVYLDTVSFSKNGVQNRNQIRTQAGAAWLTLPVKQHLGQTLQETRIADPNTAQKHFKTLAASYGRTPGFLRWKEELRALFAYEGDSLCELSIATTEWMLSKLNVTTRRVRASEMEDIAGRKSSLVAALCGRLDAATYLTGPGALDYLDPEDFRRIGCGVRVQEWALPPYPQPEDRGEFIPHLSALDLLLSDPDCAGERIRAAGRWQPLWEFAEAAPHQSVKEPADEL